MWYSGCYINLGNLDKAKELLDAVPDLLDKRKIGGKGQKISSQIILK
jgi:hypothetical protein